jgi:hypothetical protein
MTRWIWTRWVFAIVTGSLLAGPLAADELPKAGETITLKFAGQPDKVMTVVKATRKPDGSVETEVKDAKTGEAMTLVDPAPEKEAVKPAAKPALPPLPKPVTTEPAKPVVSSQLPMPLPPGSVAPVKPLLAPKPIESKVTTFAELPTVAAPKVEVKAAVTQPVAAKGEEKRLLPRVFNRDAETPQPAAAAPGSIPPVEEKKPGILGRVFGKNKSTPAPAMPATSLPTNPTPAMPARVSVEPPRSGVKPVTPPSAPGRVESVAPPTAVIPAPPSVPAAPGVEIPAPLPSKPVVTPSIPAPPPVATPSIPAPPPVSVPSIPTPLPPVSVPPPQSKVVVKPAVQPASHEVAIDPGLPADIQPLAAMLKDSLAPSARITAAKGLAQCRHASSDAVKAVLFHAVKTDPCPAVQAECIERLAKLGYSDPAFLKHVKAACTHSNDEVRTAAKAACDKLIAK